MSELFHWIDVRVEKPDADRTVLITCAGDDVSDPVWLGYWTGEEWRTADGQLVTVLAWGEMPEPWEAPKAQATSRKISGRK